MDEVEEKRFFLRVPTSRLLFLLSLLAILSAPLSTVGCKSTQILTVAVMDVSEGQAPLCPEVTFLGRSS